MNLRSRRIANEVALARAIEAANESFVQIVAVSDDEMTLTLRGVAGLVRVDDQVLKRIEHTVNFRFPRYFPSMPIEAFLEVPLVHPNIDPENGFVCLWREADPSRTVWDAIHVLRAVISFRCRNEDPRHLMQPEALSFLAPLEMEELVRPAIIQNRNIGPRRRPRLTSASNDYTVAFPSTLRQSA